MRYEIGQTVFAIAFDLVECVKNGLYEHPYDFFLTPVKGIHIVRLKVVERHQVRWNTYMGSLEYTHDGYVLRDENGIDFYNQYPMACRDRDVGGPQNDFLFNYRPKTNKYCKDYKHQYYDLAQLYQWLQNKIANKTLSLSIGDVANDPELWLKELEALKTNIACELDKKYPGFKIVETWEPADGVASKDAVLFRKAKVVNENEKTF